MSLRVLLERESDLALTGEAGTGTEAVELVRRTRPEVLLLDVRMPGMDGLEALRRIAADPGPAVTRVVIVTTFGIDDYVHAALGAGAGGFVLKDAEPAELVRAVRVVAAGQALLSPPITRRLVEAFERHVAPGLPDPCALRALTVREREIVAWVATGRSNDEIARELRLSAATVRTHVGRAMIKLRARDRAQLVVFALRAGITLPGDPHS